jgi:hypothetical protein
MSAYKLVDLMEGARNCVVGMANVRPGEKVIVLTDTSPNVSPLVVEAILIAIDEVKANGSLLISKPWDPRLTEKPSAFVEECIYRADKVISIYALENAAICWSKEVMRAQWEYGAYVISFCSITEEQMASEFARFPAEVFFKIATKVGETFYAGKHFELSSKNGTKLSGEIDPRRVIVGGSCNPVPYPGLPACWSFFPPGRLAFYPVGKVEGTLIADLLEGWLGGAVDEPVRLTVKDHWVTQVEGGAAAAWFKKRMDRYPNGNYVAEVAMGLNPKVDLVRGLGFPIDTEYNSMSGLFHEGVGNSLAVGGPVFSKIHQDISQERATMLIDSKPFVVDGHLVVLDDSEVREVAKKYGNPDILLAENY